MADMFDYLAWRGDLRFAQAGVNEVDALIFSGLSYIRYPEEAEGRTLEEAAEAFFALEDCENRVRVKNDLALLQAAAATERFGKAKLYRYRDLFIPEQETQFAAMTFLLDDGTRTSRSHTR